MSDIPEKKIFKQAADAYMSGKSIDDNPYENGSIFWKLWDRAFKEEARYWLKEATYD